eukprot:3399038-Amphidinium_carterae.1
MFGQRSVIPCLTPQPKLDERKSFCWSCNFLTKLLPIPLFGYGLNQSACPDIAVTFQSNPINNDYASRSRPLDS